MEGDSGGTALTLVTLLLAQMKSRDMVDLDHRRTGDVMWLI